MSLHEIKRNDTRPYWPITLTFDDGSNPSLVGAVVRFIARSNSDSQVVIDANAVITDAAAGQAEYRFITADTEVAGIYSCEWEVTFADATVQTFPTRGYDRLKVIGDLG